ncbi:MAG: hypothetical protein KH175_02695 [Collinsella sp.]|nr:hypothetical protein [Collinsella sp.]
MKPRNIAIACGVAGVAVGLAAATGIVYHKQIKSVASLKRLTDHADGYDLYAIDIAYDYDLDRIIAAGVRDDQAYIDAVVAQVLPGVPAHVQAPQFACSAFVAVDAEGRVRTGRNYDFKDDTSALLVRNHPRGGYASVGFTALNNLGDNTPLDSVAGRAAALMGPFAQLDGVNECGVSIAVLTLDSKPCDQDTQRPVINTSLAIRLVLDRATPTVLSKRLLYARLRTSTPAMETKCCPIKRMASWAMVRSAPSQSPMSLTPMSVPRTRQSLGRPYAPQRKSPIRKTSPAIHNGRSSLTIPNPPPPSRCAATGATSTPSRCKEMAPSSLRSLTLLTFPYA